MQSSRVMKSFILKIILFFAIIFVCDFIIGKCFDAIASRSVVTDYGRDNHICNTGDEDLLVFGSSRGVHHFNTVMMTDSLGISCYNCSEDGQGIILNYGRMLMYAQHHKPKVIIYDFMPNFDLASRDNHRFLKWLKPHCDRDGIMDLICSVDSTERFKLGSRIYRYNSDILLLLTSLRHIHDTGDTTRGFVPTNGIMTAQKKAALQKTNVLTEPLEPDSLKLHYFEQLFSSLQDTKIIVTVSPTWDGMSHARVQPIEDLCNKYNIRFLDFSNSPKYLRRDDIFVDNTHLNEKGSAEFTQDIIKLLRSELGS